MQIDPTAPVLDWDGEENRCALTQADEGGLGLSLSFGQHHAAEIGEMDTKSGKLLKLAVC